MDFASVYANVNSGVVRIETVSCGAEGVGTGFLISPTMILTVDHVTTGSIVISLVAGSQRTTGTVIGADPAHDVALLRAARPLTGHNFTFAATLPKIGDQVAAIGFPIGGPITFTHGDVSGLDRPITVNGVRRTGLIETDAAINPGNSGGPLITSDGRVSGLVDALDTQANGIAYAVPVQQAEAQISAWQAAPRPQPPASCSNPLGPSQDTQQVPAPPSGSLSAAQAAGIIAALNTYFDGINTGDYAAAWAMLSPRLQAHSSETSFAAGDATSFDFDQQILAAHALSKDSVVVDLSFTSIQAPDKGPNGESCDNWTLEYTMIRSVDDSWLIDAAAPVNGSDHTTC